MSTKSPITAIPMAKRHNTVWDMFATWAGANANNGTWFVGGVLAACGLAVALKVLVWSSALSYVFLSLIGYIGYRTGLSTMEIARASFGERGSYIPSLVNMTQFIGWTAVNTFIAAQSISVICHELLGWPLWGHHGGWLGIISGIVVMSILHILSVASGSKSIQMIERIGMLVVFVFVIWETVVVLKSVSLAEIAHWQVPAKFKMSTGSAVDYVAAFNLAWVTAGADFTRFTKIKHNSTITPWIGAMLGVLWFAAIGLIATIAIAVTSGVYDPNNSDPSTIATKLGLGVIALLVIVLTSMTANAVNLLAAGSAITNLFPKINLKHALWVAVTLATVVTFIPLFFTSFLAAFETFLDYVAMVLGPTIAIICTDFYLLKRRHYAVDQIGQVNGQYWYHNGVNWIAIVVFVLGLIGYLLTHQLPFLANTIGATFLDMLMCSLLYAGLMKLTTK